MIDTISLNHQLKLLRRYREGLLKQQSIAKRQIDQMEMLQGVTETSAILRSCQRHLNHIKKELKEIDCQIQMLIESDPMLSQQYQLLNSVRGIGKQLSVGLLVYTEGFRKFKNWRKFSCYSGLAPFPHQSGTSIRGRTKTSVIANKEMKALLTMCAVNMLRYNNEYRRFYDRKRDEGKHHMVVVNAIRNKIIARAFAVINRQTPYVALDF